MARIPDWWKDTDGFSKEELEKLVCPNGSFTCWLLTELNMKNRCNSCKKVNKDDTKRNT